MSKVEQIKDEIESLPQKQFVQLRQWFSEKDWHEWDKQIAQDSKSGKIEFLIKETIDEKRKGKLKDL